MPSVPTRWIAPFSAAILVVFTAMSSAVTQPLLANETEPLPPSTCHTQACLSGASAFVQQRYAESAMMFEYGLWSLRPADVTVDEYTDMTLLAAVAHRRNGASRSAASHFERLSRLTDGGGSFYAFKALETALEAANPADAELERLVDRGALSVPYPGHHLVGLKHHRAHTGDMPPAGDVESALEGGDTERVCGWLVETRDQWPDDTDRRRSLQALAYGHCLDLPEETSEARMYPDSPPAEARLRRAERLYSRVEYENALAELDAIDLDALGPGGGCRARFRRGRSRYRLKDYGKAAEAYRSVLEHCDRSTAPDPRVRSLYALGRRKFHLEQFDQSQARFEQLLEEFADRSHADDALMFLGRIARKRGNTEREKQLLERTLTDYAGGDMVHEFVWEHVEPLYREEKDDAFIERFDGLTLPERDDEYFSQGRLGYFRGRAQQRRGKESAAAAAWKQTWEQYPFSFYGYLAHGALREIGETVPTLATDAARTPPDWFFEPDWNGASVRRLTSIGLFDYAAQFEAGRLAAHRQDGRSVHDTANWRLAYLYHRAGRFEASHNIARTRISGRPWTSPEVGRLLRWRIAFPTPFLDTVRDAVDERVDKDGDVPALFALALMREESSFIEDIESWAGAVGLMQLMPSTAAHYADTIAGEFSVDRLKNAGPNVEIGIEHLFSLARRFDSHPTVMAAAYNAGGGAVNSWLPGSNDIDIGLWVEDIPYRQARHYAKRVVGSFAAYQWLSGSRQLDLKPTKSPPTK